MSRLGFKSVKIYHGETFLGDLKAVPVKGWDDFHFPNNEIRISHISPPSERSPPLAVLQTISSFNVRCKLVSNLPLTDPQSPLLTLYANCLSELKTAVVVIGNEEIHLTAMPSKTSKLPCFWCCSVPRGLYSSSLSMFNHRRLAIVFDLDETLFVANTMKSFDDRIEFLQGRVSRETDPIRISGMSAELKRYSDDRALLKQYADYDWVTDSGKLYKAQLEEVPSLSDNHQKLSRPVLRLPEKNIVLTRINPEIRDTSVLVRLRPAWEDLRSYLSASGRKRFEVFVCTMAERNYALEIWRILDPEYHLISVKQLIHRIVCVKSGVKKSLLNVFCDGICHPNLAMVIDDRVKVWERKDRPRVHVVPAFTPYYFPQAEMAHSVPVLCIARNVACNVRVGFFKEFDENVHKGICDLFYEDDISNLPPPPDVSNFLVVEDNSSGPLNGSTNPTLDDVSGAGAEQRLHHPDEKVATELAASLQKTNPTARPGPSSLPTVSATNRAEPAFFRKTIAASSLSSEPSLAGVPVKRDGCTSGSELHKRRRLMPKNNDKDMRNPISCDPPPLPGKVPSLPARSIDGCLVEQDVNKGQFTGQAPWVSQESDTLKADKQRTNDHVPSHSTTLTSQLSDMAGVDQEGFPSHDFLKPSSLLLSSLLPGSQSMVVTLSQNEVPNVDELHADSSRSNTFQSSFSSVLKEIGRWCNSKVEFRAVSRKHDLRYSVEVFFDGQKVGVGMGKNGVGAQQQAAKNALRSLAGSYLEHVGSTSGISDKFSTDKENGFIWDNANTMSDDPLPDERCPAEGRSVDQDSEKLSTDKEHGSIWDNANSICDDLSASERHPIDSTSADREFKKLSTNKENGFIWDEVHTMLDDASADERCHIESISADQDSEKLSTKKENGFIVDDATSMFDDASTDERHLLEGKSRDQDFKKLSSNKENDVIRVNANNNSEDPSADERLPVESISDRDFKKVSSNKENDVILDYTNTKSDDISADERHHVESTSADQDFEKLCTNKENGVILDDANAKSDDPSAEERHPIEITSANRDSGKLLTNKEEEVSRDDANTKYDDVLADERCPMESTSLAIDISISCPSFSMVSLPEQDPNQPRVSSWRDLLSGHLSLPISASDCGTMAKELFSWSKGLKNKGPFHHLNYLWSVSIHEELIKAVSFFWDREDHVFRFGDQELVLMPEDFDALLEIPAEASPAQPDFSALTVDYLANYLDIPLEQAKTLSCPYGYSLSQIYNICGPNTDAPHGRQQRALYLCTMGLYLFRRKGFYAHPSLPSIARQVECGSGLGSLVVAELIESLDRWASPEPWDFFEGSVILLQIWLMARLRINPGVKRRGFFSLRIVSTLPRAREPEEGWLAFFEKIKSGSQIRWVLPRWDIRTVVMQSKGYKGVILGGLTNYHVIYPWRAMRQFGSRQIIPCSRDQDFGVHPYDRSTADRIKHAWERGIRWGICLPCSGYELLTSGYVQWLRGRVRREIPGPYDEHGEPPTRPAGTPTSMCSVRRKKKADWRCRRNKAKPKATQRGQEIDSFFKETGSIDEFDSLTDRE